MAALTGWSIHDYGATSSGAFADTSATSGTISGYGDQIPFTSFNNLNISGMIRAVTGEFDLSMRVGELQEDSGGSAGSPTSDLFVGLGFTQDLDDDTAYVLAYTRNEPPGVAHLERKSRKTSKGGPGLQETAGNESGYYGGSEYLRITRDASGNITTYTSPDGTTWTELGDTGTTPTQITGSGYMVIWASDGNNTTGAKALVDNISDSTAVGSTDALTLDDITAGSSVDTLTISQSGTTTLSPTADGYVNESSTGTNYGSNTTGQARYHGGGFGRQGYLKFDGSSLADVDTATLRIYGSVGTADVDVGIYPALSATWDEGTLTYANAPGWGPGPIAITRCTTTAGYFEFDVSEYVYNNMGGDIGLVVRPLPENQNTFTFDTKEGTNSPELVVESGSGNAAPNGLEIRPNIIGYGTEFQADGWDIVKVTNTSTSGAGSFAEAVSESNRIIVFETSGTIDVNKLDIPAGNYVVAGQTAPSPGIVFQGQFNAIHGANILIQHISILSDYTDTTDPMTVGNGGTSTTQTKIVFDHVWFGYGDDECADIWNKEGGDFTFRYCVFGPGSDSSGKNYGALFGGDATVGSNFRVTLDRCLFIHCDERNPLAKAEIVTLNNCLVYNRGTHGTYISSREPTNLCNANVVGCLWIDGTDESSGNKPIYLDSNSWESGSQVWVSGCDWEGVNAPVSITDQWTDLVEVNGVTGAEASGPIDWPTGLTTMDVSLLEADLVAFVGPRPNDRLAVLQGYIDELSNRNGTHLTGGPGTIPSLAENTQALTVPSNTTYEASGYTTAEEWLHTQADNVEQVSADDLTLNDIEGGSSVDPATLTQNHSLTTDAITSASAVEGATLSQAHSIALDDITGASVVEEATVSQNHAIGTDNIEASSEVGTIALSSEHGLELDDITSSASVDNASLSQNHSLSTNSIEGGSSVGEISLTGEISLNLDSIVSASAVDDISLSQQHNLATDNIEAGSEVENTSVLSGQIIGLEDIVGGASVDSATISQNHALSTEPIEGGADVDPIALGGNLTLVLSGITGGSEVGAAAISQNHSLDTQDIEGGSSIGEISLTNGLSVPLVDIVGGSFVGSAAINQNHVLATNPIEGGSTVGGFILGGIVPDLISSISATISGTESISGKIHEQETGDTIITKSVESINAKL